MRHIEYDQRSGEILHKGKKNRSNLTMTYHGDDVIIYTEEHAKSERNESSNRIDDPRLIVEINFLLSVSLLIFFTIKFSRTSKKPRRPPADEGC